jgi:hypothetical protein
VSRTSYPFGPIGAKVTEVPEEAARLVAQGTPVVLVGEDAGALGEAVAGAQDQGSHERLLGVMVGGPSSPATAAAAAEMAGELWPWARAAQSRQSQDATQEVD